MNNKFPVVKAGVKHKSVSASIPCHSDSHQMLSDLKPPIHFPAPQQHTVVFMPLCLKEAPSQGIMYRMTCFIYTLWLVRTQIPARLRKGIQPERSKRVQKVRFQLYREGEEAAQTFMGSKCLVLRGSATQLLNRQAYLCLGLEQGEALFPNSNCIQQHNMMVS